MREHMGLYRGKRVDNGEWFYGDLIHDSYRYSEPIIKTIEIWSDEKSQQVKVDPDTVGECTGLRDKNGKLIFEGDIVQYYGTYPLEVFIEDGHTQVRWFDTVTNDECDGLFFGYDEEAYGECEIIGNVHDNPELLKGGEGDG